MSRPSTRPPSRPSREWTIPTAHEDIQSHPIPVAGFIGAFTATVFGLLITFLLVISAWLIAAHGNESVNQVAAGSGIAWLALQLTPVSIGGHVLGLLPWGFVILPIFLTWRGTNWSLKSAGPTVAKEFWQTSLYFSFSYGLLSALIATFASSDSLHVNIIDAALRSTILALCVSIARVVTYAPSRSILIDSFPPSINSGFRPGLITFLAMFIAGGLICTLALVTHFDEISAVLKLMAPQSFDGFFLTLFSLGYLPTAFVWAMAFVLGPGVNVGASSVISMAEVHTGALPAFPLFSMLPSSAHTWMKYLILIPICSGIILYLLVPRDHWVPSETNFVSAIRTLISVREFLTHICAVLVASICVFFACVASSGALGSQLLKFVGPSPLAVTSTTAVILSVVVAIILIFPRFVLAIFYIWKHRGEQQDEGAN